MMKLWELLSSLAQLVTSETESTFQDKTMFNHKKILQNCTNLQNLLCVENFDA